MYGTRVLSLPDVLQWFKLNLTTCCFYKLTGKRVVIDMTAKQTFSLFPKVPEVISRMSGSRIPCYSAQLFKSCFPVSIQKVSDYDIFCNFTGSGRVFSGSHYKTI